MDTVALGDEAGDAYLNEPAILETIIAEIKDSPPAPTPPPVPLPTPYPTSAPTSGPTSAPTSGPTKEPTASGGDDSGGDDSGSGGGGSGSGSRNESFQAGSNGDPHCEYTLLYSIVFCLIFRTDRHLQLTVCSQ